MPFIRTKIIATIGPATATREAVDGLVGAGCDVFRINFSHGTDEQRTGFLEAIRAVEAERGVPLPVIADLSGPKIRVGEIEDGCFELKNGDELTIQRQPIAGRPGRISTTLDALVDEVEPGQLVLLDDGKLRLEVVERKADEVRTRVDRGGPLRSGKGVNLPHSALKLSALTERDIRSLDWIAGRDIDFVALSFVRRASDVVELRQALRQRGSSAEIVAKIEKPQALDDIEAIIEEADAIMVARGDLGVEMDLPAVPVAQKQIARACQEAGKPCIIATQMLETMTEAPGPTRAEVSDVANAVLDLADAVMLSGETATGRYPTEAVNTMNEVVAAIEAYHDATVNPHAVVSSAEPAVAAMARAVREVISCCDVTAIGVFTATGTTARLLAKSRLTRPILAMSPSAAAVRRMGLYYGVVPVRAQAPEHTRDILKKISRALVEAELARSGEQVVVLSGRPIGRPGATNTLVIHTIA